MNPKTMKALLKTKPAKGIWMREVQIPKYEADQVLVKVKKNAICGTDMHIYHWDSWAEKNVPLQMPIGHEFVGEIVAMGTLVKGYHIGQRITGEGHIPCYVCRNCRTGKAHICEKTKGLGVHCAGAFAEYVVIPAANIIAIPENIRNEIATLLDPLGNAVHTVCSFDMVGEDVLITGAGPIGCMAVSVAKKAGAHKVVITDVNPYRLEIAKKMGADFAINVSKKTVKSLMHKTIGLSEGFDVGLEMSGAPAAFTTLIDCLKPGSSIGLLGIPSKNNFEINWGHFIFKGLTIKGIYGRQMYDTWYKMLAMLHAKMNISEVITHKFAIKDFEKAFEIMESGQSGKVILEW